MNVEEETLFKQAFELWDSFKKEVLYKNRFIVRHDVPNYIKQIAEKNKVIVEENTVLYRARLYHNGDAFLQYLGNEFNDEGLDELGKFMMQLYKHDYKAKQESGFWGFNDKDSFVPPNNDYISDGRTNPAFIRYLYTSEDPYTALVEVRPYLKSKVSVAEIIVNKTLNIADFSYKAFGNLEGFEQNLMYLIMDDFSRPSDSDVKSYIPTQYIAEFIKTLDFDGIKFNSSLHGRGRNITIFNYEKCTPVGSKLYEIEDICFEAKSIVPKHEKHLNHWKLRAYKEKRLRNKLHSLPKQNK